MILASFVAAVLAMSAPERTEKLEEGCQSKGCFQRVARRHQRAVVRPYRRWLARTRHCESHGRYWTNTGNGFYGGYQFTLSSWRAAGGWGWPHRASRLEQDFRAIKLLHLQGRGAWPNCGF